MVLDFPDPLGPTMDENDWALENINFNRRKLSSVNYLVEGPDLLPSGITFEIDQNHFVNY